MRLSSVGLDPVAVFEEEVKLADVDALEPVLEVLREPPPPPPESRTTATITTASSPTSSSAPARREEGGAAAARARAVDGGAGGESALEGRAVRPGRLGEAGRALVAGPVAGPAESASSAAWARSRTVLSGMASMSAIS